MSELDVFLGLIKVGEPQAAQGISVFPLFGPAGALKYVLLDEAIKSESVTITEIGQGGSVPNLLAVNNSADKVLIVEGDELVGAKQNRLVNASIMLGERSKTVIPVSCCEAGRWRTVSRKFKAEGTRAHHKLRTLIAANSYVSLRAGAGARADQGAVWKEISSSLDEHCAASPTEAMHEVWERRQADLDAFTKDLRPLPGQTGLVVAMGNEMAVDVFDHAETLHHMYRRLISAAALDWLGQRKEKPLADVAAVHQLLDQAAKGPAERFPSPGLGDDLRFSSKSFLGSALVVEAEVVHLAIHTMSAA